jgi:dethiobiotin synthetase
MTQAFFVTGTDTGVGKTYVACQMIKHYIGQGKKVVGMKPVAAGCDLINGEWVNEDVELLKQASNVNAPNALINPYCFKEPIAPHLAAKHESNEIDLKIIEAAFNQLCKLADVVIVEGAGGLMVPLNEQNSIVDLIQLLAIPVVLVVGVKLGCINHTLLTVDSLKSRDINLHGWVPNPIERSMLFQSENIVTIEKKLKEIKVLQF